MDLRRFATYGDDGTATSRRRSSFLPAPSSYQSRRLTPVVRRRSRPFKANINKHRPVGALDLACFSAGPLLTGDVRLTDGRDRLVSQGTSLPLEMELEVTGTQIILRPSCSQRRAFFPTTKRLESTCVVCLRFDARQSVYTQPCTNAPAVPGEASRICLAHLAMCLSSVATDDGVKPPAECL